jgi:hypothetical protein
MWNSLGPFIVRYTVGVLLEELERRRHLGRPLDAADVPPVEDETCLHVLRVVVRARRFMPVERRLHVCGQFRAQLAGLGGEVGPRRGGVGEDERAQPAGLRERVLLRKEPAPRLTQHLVTIGDSESVDEVVELTDEEIDRPELGAAVGIVRAAAAPDLVVVDDRAVGREIHEREEVVVCPARAAVEDDERRGSVPVAGAQVAGDAVPGLRLAERDGALAHLHPRDSTPAV